VSGAIRWAFTGNWTSLPENSSAQIVLVSNFRYYLHTDVRACARIESKMFVFVFGFSFRIFTSFNNGSSSNWFCFFVVVRHLCVLFARV
jgi:hypothetical protein